MLSANLGRAVRTTIPMPVHQIAHSPLVRSSCQNRALSGRAAATKAARLVAIPAVSLNHERRQRGQGPLEVVGDVITVVLEEDGPALLSCEQFYD